MAATQPNAAEIEAFLRDHHDAAISAVQPLKGGFWSSAYSYCCGDQELVLRVGSMREGFEMDRDAYTFSRPGLPVPEVFAIGDAFDQTYAISERRHGTFLEDLDPSHAELAKPTIDALLAGLRSASGGTDAPVAWLASQAPPTNGTWQGWLLDRFVDDPNAVVNGWRATLANDPGFDELFTRCERQHGELLSRVPERRDLVHGDLLHQNVLIEDATIITAVFSWKCSVRGDFLYDVAWFTFWAPWHPGIETVDMWSRTLEASDLGPADLADAEVRHHVYELNIAAQHLAWCAWTNNPAELQAVADRTVEVLNRGPLPR